MKYKVVNLSHNTKNLEKIGSLIGDMNEIMFVNAIGQKITKT